MLLICANIVIFTIVFEQAIGNNVDPRDPLSNNIAAIKAAGENDRDLTTSPITISVFDSLGVVGELAFGPAISKLTGLTDLTDVADGVKSPNRGALVGTYTNPLQMAAGGLANHPTTSTSALCDMAVLSGIGSGPAISGPLRGSIASSTDNGLARPSRDVVRGGCPDFTAESLGASKQITYSFSNPAFLDEAKLLGTNSAVGLTGATGIPGHLSPTISSALVTGDLLNQAGMNGDIVNPIYAETIAGRLPNPAKIINELTLSNPTQIGSGLINPVVTSRPGVINTLLDPGSIPSRLTRHYSPMDPKSILAHVTGINAANLGARGKFIVKSASPLAPTGISIKAENLIMDGSLAVTGSLPFLGSVRVDGTLPDRGRGNVLYECGNGNIDFVSEGTTLLGPVANIGIGGLNSGQFSGLSTLGNRLGL